MQPAYIATLNLRNVLTADENVAKIIDAIPQIYDTVENAKEVAVASAALADLQEFVATYLTSLQIISNLIQTAVDAIIQTFDISYHQLMLDKPVAGGLKSYLAQFNANLSNKADSNRPYDEGGAAMVCLMMMVNYQNMRTAYQKIQELKAALDAAETSRADALRLLTGVTNFEDLKEEFWGHYIKKQTAGTHATTQGKWKKASIGDMMPDIPGRINAFMKALEGKWLQEPNAYLMVERVKKVFDQWLSILKDIVTIIDAWKKLLLDTSFTVIMTPLVTGSVGQYGEAYPAHDSLAIYMTSIPQQIRDDQAIILVPGDYDFLLRGDQFIAGINLVFKGPSVEVCAQQVNALLKLWGLGEINLGIEDKANELVAGGAPNL